MRVHIDFETRSAEDIKVVGAYRYAMHSSTDVLCIAYALGDGEVKLWSSGAMPDDLYHYTVTPTYRFHAFNVGFERRIWHFVLHRRYGWPEVPLERWYDTQADALAMGYPADLYRCSLALGDTEKDQKDRASGTRLINLLSIPIRGTTEFRRKRDYLPDYLKLYEYCRQDVRAERAVYHGLTAHTTEEPGTEREAFLMTERINDRGVPIDRGLALAFSTLIEDDLKQMHLSRLIKATGGRVESATMVNKIMDELEERPPNLQKNTVTAMLGCPLLSDKDRTILEARQVFGNTSTAKYARMRDAVCPDGFVRDTLQYHGAATGRYAGRGIQIQNFPRSSPKNADEIARFAIDPNHGVEDIEQRYGPIQEVAKSMLRAAIRAPEGHVFWCRDYSSIEARATAWTVKDWAQIDQFSSGRDIYKVTAADMYGITYDEVDETSRQAGKIAVLACGYQGGWKALRDFAVGYGIHWTPQEAWKIVSDFRAARPLLTQAWQQFDIQAQNAINHPGVAYEVPGCQSCTFTMIDRHLRMTLPSGRHLWFPEARLEMRTIRYETPEGEIREIERLCVTHMWLNTQHQWVRRSIHGGSLFQSYVQAICRDLMVEAMLAMEADSFPIYLSVHDELATIVPENTPRSVDEFERLMVAVPDWAGGLPVNASGWEGRRFRK